MAAQSTFGGNLKLEGESEYRRALQNCTSGLRLLGSELKLATTQFENNGQKIGDLRTKNELLSQKIEQEKNIISTCSDAVKNFTSQQEKNKTEIDKVKSSLEQEQAILEKMKASTNSTSQEIDKQANVVSNLQKQLKNAETAYDTNNKKINDYKIKINNAQTEISNLSKQVNDNNSILSKSKNTFSDNAKSVKEFATEEEKAGTNSLSLGDIIKGNLISEGIIAGIKGLAGAMKTVGSTLLDVGKAALESYANYEQLIGGVETLFKDSSNVVEEYANNAYKTAGLSANEYMETVTSFSASLLQSLNSDTAKSAEVADMAITDMADNANKMGTDMASIQNAYQGFAKQNYTMLDNLKLGYGGTKSEMERLLSDAQKISGIKYDISNLSDVYNAIHVIQGELGVTGTTAKEASTTIQGSVSSMKSAWENFLTGLATGQDISGLTNNLVQSVVTVMDNVLPVVYTITETIVAEVPNLINKLVAEAPRFLELIGQTIETLIVGLQENLPQLLQIGVQLITTLIQGSSQGITEQLPTVVQDLLNGLLLIVDSLADMLPTLIPTIVQAVLEVIPVLLDNIPAFIDAGIQLTIGLANGLINAIPTLVEMLPQIIESLITSLTGALPQLLLLGPTLIVGLAKGLVSAIPSLISITPKITMSLINGIKSGVSNFISIGGDLVRGLMHGITSSFDWIKKKLKEWVGNVTKFIQKLFGIKSPSKVFRDEIGVYLAQGIGLGFTDEMGNVSKQMVSAIPSNFNISPTVRTGFTTVTDTDEVIGGTSNSIGSFNATIINNSKYTSPSENVRLLKQQYQLYRLKYGKV